MSTSATVFSGPGEYKIRSREEAEKRNLIAAKRNYMHSYRVEFRNSVVEDVGCKARMLSAHRVEAWTNDFAFFGHPDKLGEVTCLIPRSLVASVDLWVDASGIGVGEGTDVPFGMSDAITD